jgi:putative transposase
MADTYTQIHIQIVFAVQGRQNLIHRDHKEQLQKYISGIVRNQKHKLIAINCMPDHTHIFLGLRPDAALSDLVRDIKACTSAFINEQRWIPGKFCWQEGFGAFSHSHSDVDKITRYILHQEEHHRIKTFKEEYLQVLQDFSVTYNEAYLFRWIDREQMQG